MASVEMAADRAARIEARYGSTARRARMPSFTLARPNEGCHTRTTHPTDDDPMAVMCWLAYLEGSWHPKGLSCVLSPGFWLPWL
jgi:hypothetical protein